jgi:hypothetical protein
MVDIEHLGFIRSKWSGFHWLRATDFEALAYSWEYADGAIVLGFYVYRYRVWRHLEERV